MRCLSPSDDAGAGGATSRNERQHGGVGGVGAGD